MQLNDKQKEMLEAIKWLFTPHNNIGGGKSFVMAWHCVDLAMQGYDIMLTNPTFLRGEMTPSFDRSFAQEVLRIAHDRYPNHLFYFNSHTFVFRLEGTKNASIPTGVPGTITSQVP